MTKLAALTVLTLGSFSTTWAAKTLRPRAVNGPVISGNFPDPSILQVGGMSYAFATNTGNVNIQVATSPDGETWTVLGSDALPNVGSWASTGNTWAPDVFDRGDGTFVMYYTAHNVSPSTQCVGVATSSTPEGPYTPAGNAPFACPADQGGAIDPAGFQDTDGTRYAVYKIDGNSLGGGGPCGNANGSFPTPIMLQRFEADAITPTGGPVKILDHGTADGPLIEAPSLILRDGIYALFFSSNCFNTNLYDISYATASSVSGPYTKARAPLLVTGNSGLTAPGGADPTPDGSMMVFHGTLNPNPLTRGMYTATLTWNGAIVSAE